MKYYLLVLSLLFSLNLVAAEKWKITSLEWPPFSGASLPDGGAGIMVLREALKTEGIYLEVKFLPWTRAIAEAKESDVAGYYPAWPEDVLDGFSKSDVIFKSPVGFVELATKPIVWTKIEDLKGKKIGTVQDYGNTAEFNAAVKAGIIITEVVSSDDINVKKVANERIDGAFIDLNNLDFFLKNDMKDLKGKVQANSKIIAEKDLVLAINRSFKNKDAPSIIKKGLSKIKSEKMVKDWLLKYNK